MPKSNAERQRAFRARQKTAKENARLREERLERARAGKGRVVTIDLSLPDWCDPVPFLAYIQTVHKAYVNRQMIKRARMAKRCECGLVHVDGPRSNKSVATGGDNG